MPSSIVGNLFYSGPPLHVLHDEYAKRGRVDDKAPVLASTEIDIDAPIADVWRLLSDVAAWPTWNTDVGKVTLDPAVAVDAAFHWKNGPSNIRSRFAVVTPERELTWTGVSTGIRAVHRNTLEQLPAGPVRMRTEESMAAPLVGVLYPSRKLQRGLEQWLDLLKRTAEAA
ncbi:SRPBCC family protein [Dactylosporangium sp. NPDC049525]|uniref:SRPBCC family protein n=1 Tax=Dactylosporangium sp. NPDC049525 TaxID=3154730 RepID=UPI003442CC7A